MAMTVDPPSARHLTVRVSGAWSAPEWRSAQVTLADAFQQSLDVRGLLVIVQSFLGWRGSGWDDLPAPAAPALKPEEIEQVVAGIALYPDSLIAQILMASTYPLEVVQAERWAKANASLKDTALADALNKQTWDASVKSLVNFPQVLT